MFENMNEQQARDAILESVKEYCDLYHKKPDYMEGDRIPYASRVYDSHEMVNLVDSALEFWLTAGRYAEQFETEFAKLSEGKILFTGKFRFICESAGIYGIDLAVAQGTSDKKRG